MGRLTEFFGAIKEGINTDTEPLFTHIDTKNPEFRQLVAKARRIKKSSYLDALLWD